MRKTPTTKPIMSMVAYGLVLALLVAAGVVVFLAGSGDKARSPVRETAANAAPAVPVDARTARALKLPPRPSPLEKPATEKAPPEKPGSEAAASRTTPVEGPASVKPEPLAASISTVAAAAPDADKEKKPEPSKTACKVDLTRWPTDKTDQAQAIQMMLRDLGYYRGTTNGTVGPQTRTAIREFQGAAAESEAGEISEALFEALKKKCAASP